MEHVSDFESFRESWLESVVDGNPSSVQVGQRFAVKMISQWLDQTDGGTDYIYCDGSGDGGIDIAYLDMGSDDTTDDNSHISHRWYLVQSKFGKSFTGTHTLLTEGQKLIETLDGRRAKLNSLTEGVLEKINTFRKQAGELDQIVFLFVTVDPISEDERRCLNDIRAMGRERIGSIFNVEDVSLKTIYDRLVDEESRADAALVLQIDGTFVESGPDLLVGSISLIDIYNFLSSYKGISGDLDGIYERNVRRFLGPKGKINKGMIKTLSEEPHRFGLYNNGITIVTTEYDRDSKSILLKNPYIVNGCQTSRTIYDFIDRKLGAGGTGISDELEAWKERVKKGAVVAKIVKVGNDGDRLLFAITKNTNSQNSVREKDFIALNQDFEGWKQRLAETYNIYLEIQRGGWDSYRALQKQGRAPRIYQDNVNATDLIKVYGAGWFGEVGMAFGKNPPFLPQGTVFRRIVDELDESGEPFGEVDLYAAYLLQLAAKEVGFGRGAQDSRRLSRFLFFYVCVEFVKFAANPALAADRLRDVSRAVTAVLTKGDAKEVLVQNAVHIIDTYFSQASEFSVYKETAYLEAHGSNLNTFLKSEDFGRNPKTTPLLLNLMMLQKQIMGMALGGGAAHKAVIRSAIDVHRG